MPNEALMKQVDDLKKSFFAQGLLDESFTQLESLENDGNPNFVEVTVNLFFDLSEEAIATVQGNFEKVEVDVVAIQRELLKIRESSQRIGTAKITSKVNEAIEYCQEHKISSLKDSFFEMKEKINTMKGHFAAYFELLKMARTRE